jgi:hypothetical protein
MGRPPLTLIGGEPAALWGSRLRCNERTLGASRSAPVAVEALLDRHVALECLARPTRTCASRSCSPAGRLSLSFLTQHLGKPISSTALMGHTGTRFRRAAGSHGALTGSSRCKVGKDHGTADAMAI